MRPCDKCGAPGIVDGCCYDHSKLCADCNEEPVHYNDVRCSSCKDQDELERWVNSMELDDFLPDS